MHFRRRCLLRNSHILVFLVVSSHMLRSSVRFCLITIVHALSSQPQLCYIPDFVKKWTVETRPKEEILKTERQIRFELSVIKWYYTQIAQGKTNVKVSDSRLSNFTQLLADYNAAIQTAPRPVQRLWQDMYLSGTNPTQKQLAEQWCVTEKYVQMLHKRLIVFLEISVHYKRVYFTVNTDKNKYTCKKSAYLV